MYPYDTVIFDLDGTLLNTLQDLADSTNYALALQGMPARTLEELGAGTGRAVYVGDSDVDIQTAANAGLPCLSVSWGFRDAEFLTAHGAQRIVDTPQALEALLLGA